MVSFGIVGLVVIPKELMLLTSDPILTALLSLMLTPFEEEKVKLSFLEAVAEGNEFAIIEVVEEAVWTDAEGVACLEVCEVDLIAVGTSFTFSGLWD